MRNNYSYGIGSPVTAKTNGDAFGRLDSKQVGNMLGFLEHEIPILICNRLLEPLGSPAPNFRKYFARVHIMQLADDVKWLSKATDVLYKHWAGKNASRAK